MAHLTTAPFTPPRPLSSLRVGNKHTQSRRHVFVTPSPVAYTKAVGNLISLKTPDHHKSVESSRRTASYAAVVKARTALPSKGPLGNDEAARYSSTGRNDPPVTLSSPPRDREPPDINTLTVSSTESSNRKRRHRRCRRFSASAKHPSSHQRDELFFCYTTRNG